MNFNDIEQRRRALRNALGHYPPPFISVWTTNGHIDETLQLALLTAQGLQHEGKLWFAYGTGYDKRLWEHCPATGETVRTDE